MEVYVTLAYILTFGLPQSTAIRIKMVVMHILTNTLRILPSHCICLGSGTHSPFPIQVAVLDPLSTSPEEVQLKTAMVPTIVGYVYLAITSSASKWRGESHLTRLYILNLCS